MLKLQDADRKEPERNLGWWYRMGALMMNRLCMKTERE